MSWPTGRGGGSTPQSMLVEQEPGGENKRFGRRAARGVRGVLGTIALRPEGIAGLVLLGGFVIIAIFGPLIAPHDPLDPDVMNRFAGPSLAHPFGTDSLGRDLLSRLMAGTRIAALVALPAVLVACVIGVLLGLVAGWFGRRIDFGTLIVLDTWQAFPALILALTLLTLLPASLTTVVVVIAVAFAPGYARIMRAQVMLAKAQPYVETERILGAKAARILGKHILPNTAGPVAILLALDIGGAIAVEAGLSFLGLGLPPSMASWGAILRDGFNNVSRTPWPIIWTSLVLVLVTLGTMFVGETLSDATGGPGVRSQR